MVVAWIAVASTFAVLFAGGIAFEAWGDARRPHRREHVAAAYLWIPMGGALTVALLLRDALSGAL